MLDGWEGKSAAWRKVMVAYSRVYDYARVCRCGPGGRWWQTITEFMTMHAVTCRLTAWSLGSAPAPYARHEYGYLYLYLYLTRACCKSATHFTAVLQHRPPTRLTQCGQLHLPSGACSNSGSRQTRWYARGQVSHRIISPPC